MYGGRVAWRKIIHLRPVASQSKNRLMSDRRLFKGLWHERADAPIRSHETRLYLKRTI
jgi:hypothetical protein